MGEWRYIAARLNGDGTETILDTEVPLTDVSLTKNLSGPDGFSGKISPSVARMIASDGQPLIVPWSTAIYSEESNRIRHACIVTQRTKDDATLSLEGAGWPALIKGQPYTGSVFFVERDPLDIARHIWDHWQSFIGGNVGLQLDRTTKVGTLIGTTLKQVEFDTQNGPVSFEAGPYKLNEWETDDLGGKFESLATDYGFDYAERHEWNAAGTGFNHYLDFGVPRIGTRRNNLRFVVGENVLLPPSVSTSEETYASAVLVRGAGEGATMKRAFIPRAGESRLRRIYIASDNTLKSDAATRARGQALLPFLSGMPEITEFAIRDTPEVPLGSWREGDEVEIHTDSTWGNDSIWVRILSTTISPDSPNVAQVSVVRADKIPS